MKGNKMGTTKKSVLIGIDSLIPDFVERFVSEGKMPNMKNLVDKGVFSRALPEIPTLTPPNWTTIATGASVGTHGVIDYNIHYPGTPLSHSVTAFGSEHCIAEPLWATGERAGKQSIILNYPNSFPLKTKKVLYLGQSGGLFPGSLRETLAVNYCTCYTTFDTDFSIPGHDLHPFTKIKLESAEKHSSSESQRTPLKAEISIRPKETGIEIHFQIYVLDSSGEGYDQITFVEKKSGKCLAKLRCGEWSKWITLQFHLDKKVIEASFRLKLLELSPDGEIMRLYRSEIYPSEGFTYPKSLASKIIRECGPFIIDGDSPMSRISAGDETFMEETEINADWTGNAASYLLREWEWDLFFMKWHSPDFVQHVFWGKFDPACSIYDPLQAEKYWGFLVKDYELVDSIIGKILNSVNLEETFVSVVSDHGHLPHLGTILINKALAEHGLIEKDEEGNIDWSRTRAYAQGSAYIYINLKGRDPDGIVSTGKEYEEIQQKIIDVLQSIRNHRGRSPFSLILKKENAGIIGLENEKVGEVIYTLNSGYGTRQDIPSNSTLILEADSDSSLWATYGRLGEHTSHHGQHLPNSKVGIGTIESTFVAAGPSIRKGYRRIRPISLRDIAPTIAYMLSMPQPLHSEGKILFDIICA